MIKIIIADDQELIRQSLNIILGVRDDFSIVGLAKDGNEVLEIVKNQEVDVVLMDIRMPGMDGVECTKILKKLHPEIMIIMLTTFDDHEFVYSALKYGASGYLLKGISMEDLADAIRTVYNGGAMINPEILTTVVSQFQQMARSEYEVTIEVLGVDEITNAEWDIIKLVGQGKSNKEIATEVSLSEGTVRNYISSILSKLNLRDRTQLAIWEVQSGSKKYRK